MGTILLSRQLAKIRHRTHFRFDLHDVLPPSPGLVNASSVVDFAVFENDDVYKAGPDLEGHDLEMIGGAARGARLEESL